LIAVSDGVAAELGRHFPALTGRVTVIPNGVDCQAFCPDPDARQVVRNSLGLDADGLTAVFVGGDWERKGLGTAIAAIGLAPPWKLVVVGDGEQSRYVEQAHASGAGDRVVFTGATADTRSFYAAADAFLFPTTYEGFPLVALEAAASALPLLVPPVNGTSELIEGTEAGWLIERNPATIARRLEQLEDDALRLRMGAAARESACRYSWERIVSEHLELYRNLDA
jgi:UDP-glucose:(heptosyl)LPS alpha-1,3-glucosyltransferase